MLVLFLLLRSFLATTTTEKEKREEKKTLTYIYSFADDTICNLFMLDLEHRKNRNGDMEVENAAAAVECRMLTNAAVAVDVAFYLRYRRRRRCCSLCKQIGMFFCYRIEAYYRGALRIVQMKHAIH